MALAVTFQHDVVPSENRRKFRLEFPSPKVGREWFDAFFQRTPVRRHGPLSAIVLAEIGEIAALAPPGRSFHIMDLGLNEWIVSCVVTSSSEPDVRSIERFDLYDAAANQHALARFRAMQMKIVANLRREEDLTSESAVTLRRYIGFLYTTLDVLGPAWFSCKADEGVQDRLITGFEENAELFSAGKLSFEQASRNVRRLLAPVQKHLSISA